MTPNIAAAAAAPKGTILVTGANGGLGSAVVEQIASNPDLSTNYGLYAVRGITCGLDITSALKRGPAHLHEVVRFDLTKLDTVREAAEGINVRFWTWTSLIARDCFLFSFFRPFYACCI